jgi:hypothetical protein
MTRKNQPFAAAAAMPPMVMNRPSGACGSMWISSPYPRSAHTS